MMDSQSLHLHDCHVHKLRATLSRIFSLLNFLALLAIFCYRGAYFFNKNDPKYYMLPFLPWLAVFAAELLFSFLWILRQPMFWWPVTRTVFPERLPKDEDLPGMDVFICTADPNKEPTFGVMNTVISAMALNYPADKLSVYLSDDGGASVTLEGMKEAWAFATWWLPFCKRYNVKTICPQAYFQEPEETSQSMEFIEDKEMIKMKYEVFIQRVRSKTRISHDKDNAKTTPRNHPALVRVINAESIEEDVGILKPEHAAEMPLLVYVAREKRPSHPHNFKAGALNVLLRISSTLSNSPHLLVLDCDMYCNHSISAREAMSFHLDPKLSQSLAWVQFPQKFHNINDCDIYDSQMRTIWPVWMPGTDGLQGPTICGTNFYIKRKALYGIDAYDGNNVQELNHHFDSCNQTHKPNAIKAREVSSVMLEEAQLLASCTYENGTKWGEEIGFRYGTVTEDIMTTLFLQTKGWRSVYLNPSRPRFLGSAAINLDVALIQGIRWYSGILSCGLNKYFPLICSPSTMQFLHKMYFSWVLLISLDFIPILCFATIPPLCFLHGIPLYPKVSDPLFIAYAFVFISSHMKQICEVNISGGSIRAWLNEYRAWLIRSSTVYVYANIDCLISKLGIRKSSFIPTNKAEDDDKSKYYLQGKYDFRTSNMFLLPLATVVSFNLVCFVGGVARVIISRNWDTMFAQMSISVFTLFMSFPLIEGMVVRTDNGRVPSSSTFISVVVSFVFWCLGYFILLH